MSKYYICNNIGFLTGERKLSSSPTSATHMKRAKAEEFVSQHQKYTFYKARNSAKGKDYVICTPMKFLGSDGNIVDSMRTARSFTAAEIAFDYISKTKGQLDPDLCVVIDEKFSRAKNHKPDEDIAPFEMFEYSNMDSSERIIFPQNVKEEVFRRSNNICAICGKPLTKYTYTIDHIKPLSKGGTNTIENLRAVHKDCNRLKNNFSDKDVRDMSADIFCNSVRQDINSVYTAMFIRSFARGYLDMIENKIGGAAN